MMFRIKLFCLLCLLFANLGIAQNENHTLTDTLQSTQLQEIIIISQKTLSEKTTKPLATLDSYLEKANAINMVRRGSYAWEPFINGMASERSVITIDGMRIYAVCTDKMDPVTSYVETTNLVKANVHSGQTGATGATIAGNLDLERKKSSFNDELFKGTVFGGFETNNQQKVVGSSLSFSKPKFFTNVDFTLRNADNYKAANNQEILYTQFTKYNVSAVSGYKIDNNQQVEASLIYDKATNVGYAALPMDVALAEAFIGSIEYVKKHISPQIHNWQTKFYYNTITHIMDDTKRPNVPIRMDMPGWSKTFGFYSNLEGEWNKHHWKTSLSGHQNKSIAEMTMFANNPSEKDMYMLTWPGVQTNYADWFAEDHFELSQKWSTVISLGIAAHNNTLNNEFGFESMKIFYPNLQKSNTRILKRIAAMFEHKNIHITYNLGVAFGERAPSISEGYGFYLFNSFDTYDYIGNPNLKNEKSVSFTGKLSYQQPKFSAKINASYFYITNYIIGKPQNHLNTMTIGAAGVKVYEQLKYGSIFNTSITLNAALFNNLTFTNKFSYRYGTGEKTPNLPMIQPFNYNATLSYTYKTFNCDFYIDGSFKYSKFNATFGEKPLPSYTIAGASFRNKFYINDKLLLLKTGVENLFDTNYTTFADWNRLPRMGRNFYLNLVFNF